MKKITVSCIFCTSFIMAVLHGANDGCTTQSQEMLRAYSEMNYTTAKKLAKTKPGTPESRLVSALCDVYDRRTMNIARGQHGLNSIFQDQSLPVPFRIEAGLALGRTAQLMKERRDLYKQDAVRYDHEKILREVAALDPRGVSGRTAMLYLFQELLEVPERSDAAFSELETYLRDYSGNRKQLVPLHLLAEYEYIHLRKDYRNAVKHLKKGYELGFSNPSESRNALFRLAFLSYRMLGDRAASQSYFQEYIIKYPFSGQAVVARRFLNELEHEEKAVK